MWHTPTAYATHRGGGFLLQLDKNYILKGKDLIQFIDSNNRKSIPLSYFEENCYKIDIKYAPRLDYIKYVDRMIKELWI